VEKRLSILFALAGILAMIGVARLLLVQGSFTGAGQTDLDNERYRADQVQLEKRLNILQHQLDAKVPRSFYLVINSTDNEFSLFRGSELIRRDRCSTGSYILLKNGDLQQWMFKTPKGEFRVRGKTTDPVWRKPDWAFIEAGLKPPAENHSSRYEYGVLGEYALDLGQGYLIHGTLYQRFLGLPVTHGCIRLGDENLELVYRSLPVGSRVFIF
jgi:L,D-transpeptidase YbiS